MDLTIDNNQVLDEEPEQESITLAPIREDLNLFHGPSTREGAPTWSLHDPTRNLFFRIGWIEFELLSRWHLQDVDEIINAVNNETTLHINEQHIESFFSFLAKNQLIIITGEKAIERLIKIKQSRKKKFFNWLLHNYLFVRVPLVKPDHFLKSVYPFVSFIYTKTFFMILAIMGFTGIYLVTRQWDHFSSSFDYFFNWQGALLFAVALFMAKVAHELGHAFTAVRYGVRVSTMGVAFLVMWPVLYTDTSEAWKLPDRYKRLYIAAAGMHAELILAIVATFLWNFLPDGSFRQSVLLVATSTWILTLIINLY